MRLLYTTSITLPSYRANRIQIVSQARALTDLLSKDFILGIGATDENSLNGVNYIIMGESIKSFNLAWKYLVYAKDNIFTHIYCREEKLLLFMIIFNQLFFRMPIKFCYEVHHLVYLHTWWNHLIFRRVDSIISVTSPMKQIIAESGYLAKNILVAPDAVDMTLFDIKIGKDDARKKLGLPVDKKIVIYAGAIDEPWKGVGVLYEASKHFDDQYLFLILGGKPHYVEWFHSQYPPHSNFVLVGHKPHADIPYYLKAADVAVLPNSKKSEISRVSTSPMKMFEYMASGVPIVASDLPSIRDVLHEDNALLVTSDDPDVLEAGIHILLNDKKESERLTKRAYQDVLRHTWSKRAEDIVLFIQER